VVILPATHLNSAGRQFCRSAAPSISSIRSTIATSGQGPDRLDQGGIHRRCGVAPLAPDVGEHGGALRARDRGAEQGNLRAAQQCRALPRLPAAIGGLREQLVNGGIVCASDGRGASIVGTSSGLNIAAAVQVAREQGPGKIVAPVAVDSGLKYFAGDLFEARSAQP
jgi:hypothetical protein